MISLVAVVSDRTYPGQTWVVTSALIWNGGPPWNPQFHCWQFWGLGDVLAMQRGPHTYRVNAGVSGLSISTCFDYCVSCYEAAQQITCSTSSKSIPVWVTLFHGKHNADWTGSVQSKPCMCWFESWTSCFFMNWYISLISLTAGCISCHCP